jgi:uncharacterized surface protein with fasciclin (FAS1) repeats
MKRALLTTTLFFTIVSVGLTSAIAKNPTVEDSLKRRDDLSVFYQALVDTGVADELQDGKDYTIFAPTNESFEKITREKYPCFYTPECKQEVAAILRNHIVEGAIFVDRARTTNLRSLNDQRVINIAQPHKNNYSVDGKAIIYTMSFTSGILYKIEGVIADKMELSALTRIPTPTPIPEMNAETKQVLPVTPTASEVPEPVKLAPAGR